MSKRIRRCGECGKPVDRDAAERHISDLELRLADIEDAARAVCWYDWSDCDGDVVEAFKTLRAVLGPEKPIEDDPSQ